MSGGRENITSNQTVSVRVSRYVGGWKDALPSAGGNLRKNDV